MYIFSNFLDLFRGGARHLGRLGQRGGSELNVVFEVPWGGQQEGRGRTREISHAWRPQGVGGFEGVCLTHVILAPGACWGGSELRSMTPDPEDPLDPVDPVDPVNPRMSSRSCIFLQILQQK